MFSVKSFGDQAGAFSLAVSLQLLCTATTVITVATTPALAAGADTATTVSKATAAAPVSGATLKKRTANDAEQMNPQSMLSDLRDTRLTLNQLKQQAVNLFLEATRTRMTVNDAPIEQSPTAISLPLFDNKVKYLAPRKEWLVLYVNTLEPIVHLLSEDINDVDTNGRNVTKVIEERINPLWMTWRDQVIAINKSLDQVHGSMPVGDEEESADSNSVIAKAALDMFQRAEELEKVRYRAALILIEEYKKDAATKGTSASPATK
ncbi:hypothetical protein KBI23_17810 [bacterium]|nr:hypothetical protein [bacterium]MBP9806775.1 hypothetical protein [bacterium]